MISDIRPVYNRVEFIDSSIIRVAEGMVEFTVNNHRVSVHLLPTKDLLVRGQWLYDGDDSVMAGEKEQDWNIAAADALGYGREVMILAAQELRSKMIEELVRFKVANPVVNGLCDAWDWIVNEYDSNHTDIFKKVLMWRLFKVEELTDSKQITQFLKKINELYHLVEDVVGLRTDGNNVCDRVRCARLETSYLLRLAAELRRVAASVFTEDIQSNNPRVLQKMVTHEFMINVLRDAAGGSFEANGKKLVMCVDFDGNTDWQP